jgi:hypothetical protein
MTLKIGWLHEAEQSLGTWLHEADDWHSISVLAAVEAKPAAPVLAALAASTASARTAGGLVMARKPARPNHQEFHDAVPSRRAQPRTH